jgi:hypothetical protein
MMVLAYNLQFASSISTDQIGLIIGMLVVVIGVAGVIRATAQF